MRFIQDVYLELALGGREVDLVPQVAHIFDAGIGSRIDLDQIEEAILIDRLAVLALITRTLRPIFGQAIDSLRQEARQGGFPGAARPGKQVRMPDSICSNGIFES